MVDSIPGKVLYFYTAPAYSGTLEVLPARSLVNLILIYSFLVKATCAQLAFGVHLFGVQRS